MKVNVIEFLDFFAGIGGFRFGFEKAGFVCRGHCEIDKYANKSYMAMHDVKENEWFEADITKISSDSIPNVDIWTAGSPCQNFSVSGDRSGLHGERSGLFFEFARLLRECNPNDRPRWIIVENVKGIFSANNGFDFGIVLHELASVGYSLEYAVCNTKDFGLPQNRERVYIIGDITGRSCGKIFPLGRTNPAALKQVIGGKQGERIYDTSGLAPTQTCGSGGFAGKTGLFFVDLSEEPAITKNARCITTRQDRGISKRKGEHSGILHSDLPRAILNPSRPDIWQNGRRIKEADEAMFTLLASNVHGIMQKSRIRRLTPRECFRLQGFSDASFDKAAAVCSDAQLYKQAGNAVSVPVVYEIAKQIGKIVDDERADGIDDNN